MDKHVWERVREILPIVRELPLADRHAYLDEACAGDEGLRREVDSLLAADLDRVAFLEAPPLRLLDSAPSPEGRIIGAYRITRELGHGGMGTVYLAARADQEFEGQVAIKLLRPIHATPEIEWRFQQEIQILANLNHPNIAKLYEVGRTEEGIPYFIMEPVDGRPITRFCVEHNLSITERLRLFQKICGAVEYAHQNLVVHRDLKPSNILVTPTGEPKLLDFGIAKLLQSADSPDPATVTRLRFFTPDYASPEQVSGKQITTASDVYSLGVLLYELLTGSLPYSLKGHTEEEVRRIVCEQEPEIPSRTSIQKLSGSTEASLSQGEAHRDRASRKLRRQLQGDLDKIVMMALRKEPSRRYPSVRQLAEDIDAHLQGFPVLARGDSWRYKTTKFLRRNRLAATLTIAVVVLSLGFGILMALQQRQTARERDRATWISEFLTETFESANPGEESWNTVTARDLLDQAAERLHLEDSTDPLVAADLSATIGNAYRNLGLREQAQPLLERALSLRRKTFGEGHPLVAESLTYLASLFQEKGDFVRAKQHLSEATRILEDQRRPDDALQAHLLNELGRFYYANEQFQLAETSFAKAIVFSERAYGINAPDTVTMRLNLAVLAYRRGQYRQAERLYKEIFEAHKKIYGPEHPKVAFPLVNLAVLYLAMGRFKEAEPLYLRALEIQEKALGPNHTRVANTLSNMSTFYRKLKRYSEAEVALKRAVQIKERNLSPHHPSLATSLNSLALLYKAQKRYKEAELLYRRALAIREKNPGPDSPSFATILDNLGVLYYELKKYDEAERYYLRSRQIFLKTYEKTHPRLVDNTNNIAALYTATGRFEEAEDLFREVLSIREKVLGKEHPDYAHALRNYASLRRKQGRISEATELEAKAEAIMHTRQE